MYRGTPTNTLLLLWRARVDGQGGYRRQTGTPAHPDVQVEEFRVTADERFILYRSDEDTEGLIELFVSRIGPVRARAPEKGLPDVQKTAE